MSDVHNCHPLHHQGASRIGRLVQALHPDAFRLDERTLQDLIVEAHRFAQTLKFFDETNTQPPSAYWERFWEVEILTYLAVVAATDTDEIQRQYEDLDKKLGQVKSVPGSGKKAPASSLAVYLPLLENLRLLALSLEEAYQKLVRIKHPLQTLLLNRIRRDNCCDEEELEGALVKLIRFHKGADVGPHISKYTAFFAPDKRWGLVTQVDYDAISANTHFSRNDLRELFKIFYNTWLVLKNAAQTGFDIELARMELPEEVEYRIVQPHVVLFLVFLRLFRYAQDSLNELGTKHLDFYYEEVLGLHRRGEVPDEVYLLFELAKDFDQHFLGKGTEFLAGKDKNGQPLLFETIEDWVLRPAQVADIKNTWIDPQCGGIHANPDVKKAYSDGAEKPNENAAHWRSMGDDRHLPDEEVGFAIASPQLILREGKRIVDVWFKIGFLDPKILSWLKNFQYLKAYLSTEESWIELEYNPQDIEEETSVPDLERGSFNIFFVPAVKHTPPDTTPDTPAAIHFRAVLERDDPPVVRLGEELAEKAGFESQWPMLKIVINTDLEKPCPTDPDQNLTSAEVYEKLRQIVIDEAVIKVDVRGVRENLIIQTDQGVFNGTEKVFPFGPQPEIGHFFYIGSTEVFQKALTELKVKIFWIGAPKDFGQHYLGYTDDATPPNALELAPKVQVDFIDRADATLSDQKEKVEFESDEDEIDVDKKIMDVHGEVFDLADPPSTGQLSVTNNSNTSLFDPIPPSGGKYEVDLKDAPFGSDINLKESGRDYTFPIGKTNLFKAYLLPTIPKPAEKITRDYPLQTEAEIEINYTGTPPDEDPKIMIGSTEVKFVNGKYTISTSSLKDKKLDLTVEVKNYQKATLTNDDYDPTEFDKYSKITVKLYSSPASPPPVATLPTPASKVISGKVFNRSGAVIIGADVSAYKPGQSGSLKSVKSASDGSFSFSIGVDDTGWVLQAFYAGARSTRVDAETNKSYAVQISDEITVSNPFEGLLKGSIKCFGNNAPIWGAKLLGPAPADVKLGESREDGTFTISGLSLSTKKFKVVHEAFEPLSAEIDILDNAEFKIILVPKPTYLVFSGKVAPFFNESLGLADVEISVKDTGIKAKSDEHGAFAIAVPVDLVPSLTLAFSKSGFKTIYVDTTNLANPISYIKLTLPEANPVELLVIDENEKKIIRDDFEVAINPLNVKRDPRTQDFSRYSPTLKRGFLRFKLVNGDLLHNQYPKVLVKQTIALAKDKAATIPNPPYTPATNYISLDYTSTQVITGDDNDGIDQYFHLLPFNGHKWISLEALPPETVPKIQLIYPYMPDDTKPVLLNGSIQPYAPGNLFIGVSELQPGSALSLLFQIAGGTEIDPEALAPAIHWSYLAKDNTWLPFKTGEIIKDNTHGLTRSGLIQFAIPTTAVRENTMLNPEYFWLRAAAKQADLGKPATKVQALPSFTNIRAQVVQARFKNLGNDLSHLAEPLPVDTISKLVESQTAVKKVEQPLESFGGRLPESMGLAFYYRVSERLRHKDRAVTVWDYEHLLLEQYPEVAAAKCIQHTRYKPASAASELAPGYVTVAVIPDLKKRKGEPWPEPRFTQGDLDDMRGYLAAHANLFVAYGEKEEAHLQVLNPLYEKVDVLVTVAFIPGIDEAFYKEQLQTELTHYLSPWLADPSKPPAFERSLERSAILQFIEERPYVDYIDLADPQTGAPKFLIRMQVIDIAGRPLVFSQHVSTATVTTIKSRYIDGKICPSTARSVLIAGDVVVGSTKDVTAAKLPPMPAIKEPMPPPPPASGNGGGSASSASKAPDKALSAGKAAPSVSNSAKTTSKTPKPAAKAKK